LGDWTWNDPEVFKTSIDSASPKVQIKKKKIRFRLGFLCG